MQSNSLITRLSFPLASSLAALALTSTPAHAAPTVWNVNIGSEITTSDNFVGAAPENTTPNSFWNSFVTADLPAPKSLLDSTGAATAVTFGVTAATMPTIGTTGTTAGDEIFKTWLKGFSNTVDFTCAFAGLNPADTYELVIYADWYWQGGAIAISQTAGTGLAAPFVLNYGSAASNDVGPLLEDTNPNNVSSVTEKWNFARFKTLTPDGSGNLAFLIDGGNWPIAGFQLVKMDLGDTTAPTPNPMTWATAPAATSPYSITMTATTASDPSGVEYKFTETSGNPGATSSDWQSSPVYTDTGLDPATSYTYTVTARDKAPGQNPTAASAAASATTDPADIIPPDPSPMTWAAVPAALGETVITMTATTATDPNGVEYLFTETTGNPGATSSSWQDSPIYTDTGLQPGTTYTYTVTARDKAPAQTQTAVSTAESATTAAADTSAPSPSPMSFAIAPAATSITKITMTATTATDPNGVEYYFTETTGNPGGSDSGWQDSPIYTDAGLTPGTSYTYTVKARDKSLANNETAASAPASASTDTETVVSSVWNVNIGNQITTGDNFAGAAPENTVPNSFWNSVTTATPSGMALADAVSSTGAGVTLTLTAGAAPITYADYAAVTGLELFSSWIKSSDNATPFTMTIGGLSASKTYGLVIYSDWYWKGNGTLPLTQTAGTGLSGTVTLDQISTGTNGAVPALVQDTDLAANSIIEGNWIRINGLTPDANGNLSFLMGGTNAAFSGFQMVYPSVVASGFTTWSNANAGGQSAVQDFDNDGVENGIEYFMGQTGSSFTATPGLDGSNTITWPVNPTYDGTYEIQTSPDLENWTNVDPKPVPSGGVLSYTLPPGAPTGKSFVRLRVTPTP